MMVNRCQTAVQIAELMRDGFVVERRMILCKNQGDEKSGICKTHRKKACDPIMWKFDLCLCGLTIDKKIAIWYEKSGVSKCDLFYNRGTTCSRCNAHRTAERDQICMFRKYIKTDVPPFWFYKDDAGFCRENSKPGERYCEKHCGVDELSLE